MNDHVVARVTQWRATTKRAIIQVISEVVARTKRMEITWYTGLKLILLKNTPGTGLLF